MIAANQTIASGADPIDRRELSRRVDRDTAWLLAGYAVTAGSGAVFWILVARLIPPAQLGIDTAILSVIMAAAAIASTGIGNGLLVTFSIAGSGRRSLLRTATSLVVGCSAVAGVIGGVLVGVLLPVRFEPAVTIPAVTVGTMLWALFALQSPALTGLGKARWTLFVNGPVNLAKLAVLPVLVITAGAAAHPAVLATLAPAAVATIVVSGWLLPRLAERRSTDERALPGTSRIAAPIAEVRKTFLAYVLRDGPATGLSVAVGLSLAFLVTVFAGPAEGALFALCYQFSIVLDLVAVGFGTSLAVHASGTVGSGRAVAFRTWARIAAIVAVSATALICASPLLFALLGGFYGDSGIPVLAMLVIACLLRTPYGVWCSLLRAEHRASVVLIANSIEAALILPLVIVLAGTEGAQGAAAAVLLVAVALGVAGTIGLWGPPLRKAHP